MSHGIIIFTPHINMPFDITEVIALSVKATDGYDAMRQFVHFGVTSSIPESHIVRIFLLKMIQFVKHQLPCNLPKCMSSDLDQTLLDNPYFVEAVIQISTDMKTNKFSSPFYDIDDSLMKQHFEQFEKQYGLILGALCKTKTLEKWLYIRDHHFIGDNSSLSFL